jgi:glycosyltransferase involved in cell wall biosynthesis
VIAVERNRRVRVLHLGSPTGLYGAERWILAVARHLPAADIESVVAAVRDDPSLTAPVCRRASALGLEARVFEGHGRLSLDAVRQIRAFIRSTAVDIVHSHGYKTDLIGVLAAAGTRCRTVTTPHGWSTDADWRLRIYEALDRASFPFFDAVVPLSEKLRRDLAWLGRLRGNLHLIPNGLDLDEVTEAMSVPAAGDPARSDRDFVVGFVGRLIPLKAVDVLMRAFAHLDRPGKQLWIVGDGPEGDALKALAARLGIASAVRFFGYREDRLAILGRMDVLALPSRSEGTPRCVLEAMAARVPVLTSDAEGCRILVRDDETGLLSRVDDAAGLARQLGRLATDAALRLRLAEAGRAFVEREFSARLVASRYADLYHGLLAPGAPREALPPARGNPR